MGGGEIAKVIPSTSNPIGIDLDLLGLRLAIINYCIMECGIYHLVNEANIKYIEIVTIRHSSITILGSGRISKCEHAEIVLEPPKSMYMKYTSP